MFEIVMTGSDAFIEALAPVLAGPGSAEEKLVAGLKAHIDVVATHLDTSRVFLHEWLLLSPERRALVQQRRDRYEAMWTEIIQSGIDEGVFAPVSVRYARLVLLSVANWVYLWYDPTGPLGPGEMAEVLASLLLSGLKGTGQASMAARQDLTQAQVRG